MKVLVSGCTGFLGRYVVEHLINKGIEVVGIDYRESNSPVVHANYREYICDIRDYDSVRKAGCGHIDVLIHLAAIPSIAKGTLELYQSVNVGGTESIVRAAKELGAKRVIYTSSSTVYGKPEACPIREDFKTPPIGKYGSTKLAAEKLVLNLNQPDSDISGIVIRPRVIMGPGRMGIFDILFNAIYQASTVFIIGKGSNRFQFTDVRDLCDVITCFLTLGRGGLYNVGCDTRLTVNELLLGLVAHSGRKSRLINLPVAPIKLLLRVLNSVNISPLMEEQFNIADLDFVLDTSKVRNELGWAPKYTDLQCISNAYDWWVAEGKYEQRQFKSVLGLLGRFKSAHQSGFQKD